MLNSKTLPEETQKELETLRHTQLEDLNADQLAFLKARRDYLTPDERLAFGVDEAVEAKSEALEAPSEEAPAPKRKK